MWKGNNKLAENKLVMLIVMWLCLDLSIDAMDVSGEQQVILFVTCDQFTHFGIIIQSKSVTKQFS